MVSTYFLTAFAGGASGRWPVQAFAGRAGRAGPEQPFAIFSDFRRAGVSSSRPVAPACDPGSRGRGSSHPTPSKMNVNRDQVPGHCANAEWRPRPAAPAPAGGPEAGKLTRGIVKPSRGIKAPPPDRLVMDSPSTRTRGGNHHRGGESSRRKRSRLSVHRIGSEAQTKNPDHALACIAGPP